MPSPSSSSSSPSSLSRTLFKVFIIEECHVLTKDVWDALLKILEKPVPMNLVFILITSSPIEIIPSNVVSVCQCLAFPKIEQSDIMERLQALSRSENLEAEPGALELVAMRADGSMREAEMMLDQLTLLGPKISVSIVHELVR
jgi:DNA polymerase III gamma/tau subunit